MRMASAYGILRNIVSWERAVTHLYLLNTYSTHRQGRRSDLQPSEVPGFAVEVE